MVDEASIVSVAERYNVPPALLVALSQQGGDSGLHFALSSAHISGIGFTAGELAGNDNLQLEVAARMLNAAFDANGSWEAALSAYATGDPTAWQSPTSPVGGFVDATLGMAAASPLAGLDTFKPSSGLTWLHRSDALSKSMESIRQAGGIVSQQHLQSFHQGSVKAAQRAGYRAPSAVPIIGSTAPFDPQYDQVTQPFGPSDLGMEPAYGGYEHFHMGTDYAVPENTPLRAIVGGTVHVNTDWGGGNAITITAPDGSTYLYGHDNDFTVSDGDTVKPGQVIAHSGSTGMSTGPHLHFEVRDKDGNLVDGDPLVQSAVTNARIHPQADTPHPELVASGQKPAFNRQDVLAQIDAVAQRLGVDPRLARAISAQETGGSFDPNAVGDTDTDHPSYGPFQLRSQVGELGNRPTSDATNPTTAAEIALSRVAEVQRQHPDWTPGQIAAEAQNPGDHEAYAAGVDAWMQNPIVSMPAAQPAAPPAPKPTDMAGWRPEDTAARLKKLSEHPEPAAVGSFAQRVNALGIDISHFAANFAQTVALRMRLGQQHTSLEDFAKYNRMTIQQIAEAIRAEPHPTYPEVTKGAFGDAMSAAFMHSLQWLHATPTPAEGVRFAAAGFKHSDIGAYYQHAASAQGHGLAQSAQADTQSMHGSLSPAPQPAQNPRVALDTGGEWPH